MAPRSKVETLPAELREWLDAELVRGGFANYVELAAGLKARGVEVSKSSVHRYGSKLEERLAALRTATNQAKAIVEGAPDEEGAINEALMRLVQEKLFNVLMDLEIDPETVKIEKVTRAIADLGRATITQKRWQLEVKAKIKEKLDRMEGEAGKTKGRFDLETLRRVREEIYGLV